MAADRDLAIAFVRAWRPGAARELAGWEVTAATGVRGLRLLTESGAFASFVLTEANDEAFATLARNAARHPGAVAIHGDGRNPPPGGPFDFVDIDPYGSPAPFVPGALASLRTGGVVGVTATDMLVLAGAQPAATMRRYGAVPVRGRLGPESGLRILLMFLARAARSQGRSIRPLLSYVREHYVRTYVELVDPGPRDDPIGTIDSTTWSGPLVGTKGPYGPLWVGPLFEPAVVARLATPDSAAQPREVGAILARISGEAGIDGAFYYEPNSLAASLRLAAPPSLDALLGAISAEGYRAARTHVRPEGVRTDAPRSAVERIARGLAASRQSQNARVRA
jgi:tRNA (guanine26-N2/guanine27-N2)-dimethyltransferase